MSLRWLYLAVLGPLVLLAGLAWWGSQAQLKAAWTEAREESQQLLGRKREELKAELLRRSFTVARIADPPVPGEPSPLDAVLDGSDPAALARVRDDPEAGISPAGLPRQVLAALRLHHLEPTPDHRLRALEVVAEHPSVLDRRACEVLDAEPDQLALAEHAETARRIANSARSNPAWTRLDGGLWWVARRDSVIHFGLPDGNAEVLAALGTGLPAWARLALFADGAALVGDSQGTELASGDAHYPAGGLLSIRVVPDILEAPIRRQQRWTLALLAAAVLTAGLALFSIHRTVARERRLAEMKSQFVSSVSHELRAPLGSIRLMAEALQQEKVARPAEFHTLIAREGARLSHLIENVLDFARIEDGRKRYRFEESDLSALVRETLRVMQPLARERDVQLAFELDEITATLDPGAIQQALVNLLDNAIKFSPERGVVHLHLHATESRWQLSVRDHGPGIPRAEQRAIFERFHRLGNELRRETRGAGIGLSIVQHVAEAHHGRITVKSSPPDGSTFTLDLPLDPPPPAP